MLVDALNHVPLDVNMMVYSRPGEVVDFPAALKAASVDKEVNNRNFLKVCEEAAASVKGRCIYWRGTYHLLSQSIAATGIPPSELRDKNKPPLIMPEATKRALDETIDKLGNYPALTVGKAWIDIAVGRERKIANSIFPWRRREYETGSISWTLWFPDGTILKGIRLPDGTDKLISE